MRQAVLKIGLLVLIAWTAACASIRGQAGAIRLADASDAGDLHGIARSPPRTIIASARPDVQRPPHEATARGGGQHASLDVSRARPVLRTTDRHAAAALELSRNAHAAAGDPVTSSPEIRTTSGRGDVDVSALRPGPWPRKRWMSVLTEVLSSKQLAHAAMWIGDGPLRLKVSTRGFFVAIRVATP